MDIHKKLLSKGYFPDEMGFWVNSMDFANVKSKINLRIQLDRRKLSKPMKFSIPKGKYNRRRLAVPNPYHYFFLCKEMHRSWSALEAHIKSSTISLTTPILKSKSTRAISRKFSFEQISSMFINASVGANYVLKTDISMYYSTIYTHSIPWALHGKTVAKANRSDGLLGNFLDRLVRNGQDGQTMGIPIGPDTSLIISEIIGVALDNYLINKNNYISAFRYIDDYYVFYNSMSDAEETLAELQKVVGDYELDLNREKTKILEMPQSIEPIWVSQINNIVLDNNHLISFISLVYSLIKQYPNEDILRYALARLKKLKINKKNWEIVQSFILNSILYDSSGMPLACSILSEYYHKKFGIDKNKIIKTLENIIMRSKHSNCDYELVWMLWLAHLLKVRLTDDMLVELSDTEHPLVILILLSTSSHRKSLNKTKWIEYMVEESLYNDYWLLAYEAYVRGWLYSKTGVNYIENDEFFKILKDNEVHFFDTNCRQHWINKNIDKKWLPIFSPAF
ncbi:RNA-directed DNA polymerase [Vallitalea guaymasensis]|uniref:RNA-directed DNA polymerase n=1 Tax=Vallitalea guaymasensis TaxID=1185412 RepID=UPI002353483D|nr:RNA-directed DNA polymerase [Vallitalea guaymasensis]